MVKGKKATSVFTQSANESMGREHKEKRERRKCSGPFIKQQKTQQTAVSQGQSKSHPAGGWGLA